MALAPPNDCPHGVIEGICWRCTREKHGLWAVIDGWLILKVPIYRFLWLCDVHGVRKILHGRRQISLYRKEIGPS